jgi:hypothetical protein
MALPQHCKEQKRPIRIPKTNDNSLLPGSKNLRMTRIRLFIVAIKPLTDPIGAQGPHFRAEYKRDLSFKARDIVRNIFTCTTTSV